MTDFIKVSVDGKEEYLNDLLVCLPDYDDNIIVELEGVRFELIPEDAKEFQLDYGRDQFSQSAAAGAHSLASMRECEYACGFVRELKEAV